MQSMLSFISSIAVAARIGQSHGYVHEKVKTLTCDVVPLYHVQIDTWLSPSVFIFIGQGESVVIIPTL